MAGYNGKSVYGSRKSAVQQHQHSQFLVNDGGRNRKKASKIDID
jgi:hypothetical protein